MTTRAPTSIAETFASLWKRLNSRMSVCLCERGARIHASPRLAYCADFRQTGNTGASDLVGMPASFSRLAATLGNRSKWVPHEIVHISVNYWFKKKSFWIPIEEDLRHFFVQLVFFNSACGPRKAMHYEGTGGVKFKISRFLSRISPKRWEIEIRSLRH